MCVCVYTHIQIYQQRWQTVLVSLSPLLHSLYTYGRKLVYQDKEMEDAIEGYHQTSMPQETNTTRRELFRIQEYALLSC